MLAPVLPTGFAQSTPASINSVCIGWRGANVASSIDAFSRVRSSLGSGARDRYAAQLLQISAMWVFLEQIAPFRLAITVPHP